MCAAKMSLTPEKLTKVVSERYCLCCWRAKNGKEADLCHLGCVRTSATAFALRRKRRRRKKWERETAGGWCMTCDAESARWSPLRRRWEQRLKRDFDGVWWWAQIRKRTIIYGKRKVQIWICSLRGWQVTWKLQVWSLWSTRPEHACLITCYTGLWMNLYI